MILVDVREREVASCLTDRGVPFESASLLVGDFEVGDYIIERKSVQDLAASIKDGRYAEQKQRLASVSPEKHVIFVIEGPHTFDDSKKKFGLLNTSIVSAVMMTSLRDSYFLFQTSNPNETSHFLTALEARLEKIKEGCSKVTSYEPNVVKLCRRENVTLENCFRTQLCTIPLISLKTADAIREHLQVESMCQLVKKLEEDEKSLLDVPGVGPGVAKSVLQFLGIKEFVTIEV